MIKDQKEFYNYIRKEYKNMEDADKIPNFMNQIEQVLMK